MSLLHETVTGMDRATQFYGLQRTVEVSTGRYMVKLRIDLRTDAKGQGHYRIDTWTSDGWSQVAMIHQDDPDWPAPSGYLPPEKQHEKYDFLDHLADNLVGRALTVLS